MKATLIILISIVLAGCSLWQASETSRQRMAVQYAVLKITDGEEARAERVREVVTDLREGIADAQKVTVSDLMNQVRDVVRWDRLDMADQVLIREILNTAEQRLKDELGTDPILGERRLKLHTLFDWIEQAAK